MSVTWTRILVLAWADSKNGSTIENVEPAMNLRLEVVRATVTGSVPATNANQSVC